MEKKQNKFIDHPSYDTTLHNTWLLAHNVIMPLYDKQNLFI